MRRARSLVIVISPERLIINQTLVCFFQVQKIMLLLHPAYWSAQRFFIKSYNVFVYGPEFARLTVTGDQGCKTCTQDLPEER